MRRGREHQHQHYHLEPMLHEPQADGHHHPQLEKGLAGDSVGQSVLFDTILSLSLMICYGLTAIVASGISEKELFASFYNFVFKLLFPLLGGLGLWFVFFVTIRDSASPDYSGSSVSGSGPCWCSDSG